MCDFNLSKGNWYALWGYSSLIGIMYVCMYVQYILSARIFFFLLNGLIDFNQDTPQHKIRHHSISQHTRRSLSVDLIFAIPQINYKNAVFTVLAIQVSYKI